MDGNSMHWIATICTNTIKQQGSDVVHSLRGVEQAATRTLPLMDHLEVVVQLLEQSKAQLLDNTITHVSKALSIRTHAHTHAHTRQHTT